MYIGQAFRKMQALPAKYSCKLIGKLIENWQRMPKYKWNVLFFGDKFLALPIINSKYMPCLPNATFSNDGNVPGTTLWVRKMLSCMISAKN